MGELRVAAYTASGFMSETSRYAPRLRALGADGVGSVLIAVAEDGRIVGTVMLQTSQQAAEIAGPEEAEIRALAVDPGVRGQGIGQALLRAAQDRAAGHGKRHLVLLTQPEMAAARRLYERAGFRRLPERDWIPEPGVELIAYGLHLDGAAG